MSTAAEKAELKETIDALEKRIDQCRILYELYFNGVEKREPHWHRQEIVRVFTRLQRNPVRNATLRFRLQNLRARFNSFKEYWDRVNYQREQGTYHKDRKRAKRRLGFDQMPAGAKDLNPPPPDDMSDTDEHPTVYSLEDLNKADLGASERKPNLAAQAAAASTDRASAGLGGRLTDDRCHKLYNTYIKAKQQCGESADRVSYNAMVRSMAKQIPVLEQKGYRDIDFKVVIRNGKAALKPVGKK